MTLTKEQQEAAKKLQKQQRAIADGVLAGKSNRQAYIDAGYKSEDENSIDASASRALSNVKVAAYLDLMRASITSDAIATREEILEGLTKDFRGETKGCAPSDRQRAAKMIVDMQGFNAPEKKEVDINVNQAVSDELSKKLGLLED